MMKSTLVFCLVALAAVLGCDGLAREKNMRQNKKEAGVDSLDGQTTDFSRKRRTMNSSNCSEEKCDAPMEDAYMTFKEMEWYLQKLEARYPAVEVSSIGKTEEGRDLWLVKMVQQNEEENNTRVAVWIEAGIHAREWIASSTSFHLVEMIAKSYNSFSYFDYFIVPMANPDGYEYSRSTDRMWRKNRSKNNAENKRTNDTERDRGGEDEDECVGVDLNRNWDFQFSVAASNDSCNDLYHGPFPFSELETKALSDAMIKANETHKLDVILSLHSYGNSLMFPWGYTSEPIEDADTLKAAGEYFVETALKVNGTKFKVKNTGGGLYLASGSTDDWSKFSFNSSLVFTLELRTGKENEFEIPEEEIKPTADEVYAGLEGLLEYYQTNIRVTSAVSALTGWTPTVAIVTFFHFGIFIFSII